jgi:two-component system, chemotaxis family, protein-glutamate methylesterase/glutaminase
MERNAPRTDAPSAVVCVGASAGGIEPLEVLVADLPADLDAAVLVVVHLPGDARSSLDRILARAAKLPVAVAEDGDVLQRRVLVASPGRHLTVHGSSVRLVRGARENGVRPAIDPLFRTAAASFRERTVAILLSGTGADGPSGAAEVKEAGGTVLAQDPQEALFRRMLDVALERGVVDATAAAADLGLLAATSVARLAKSVPGTEAEGDAMTHPHRGPPSGLTCPECGEALWDGGLEPLDRLTCRMGHSYSPESLFGFQETHVENVLWSAARALEERADLSRRIAERVRRAGNARAAERYGRNADESSRQASFLKDLLVRGEFATAEEA